MRYTGENLDDVLKAHRRWFDNEGEGGPVDSDRADFSGSKLYGKNFADAALWGADFRGADARDTSFRGADLRRADFTGANIYGADFFMAKIDETVGLSDLPLMCPDTGEFTAWKKAIHIRPNGVYEDCIVKLIIPEDAERVSGMTRACRASKARVLEIQTMDGQTITDGRAVSFHDHGFIYAVGETVTSEKYESDRWRDHSPGIYFFINRRDAVEYYMTANVVKKFDDMVAKGEIDL